jgi:hypothetical protein
VGFGPKFESFLPDGLEGTEGRGNGADGRSWERADPSEEVWLVLLVLVVVGWELCPSLALLTPSSAPMLEVLEVKLFSPPLVKAGGLYDVPAEAADTPSCPEGLGSGAGVEGKRTLPFDRSGPEPPPRAR